MGLSGQMQPGDTIEFMRAACQGNMSVIDKYLEDGGNPDIHDEVQYTHSQKSAVFFFVCFDFFAHITSELGPR